MDTVESPDDSMPEPREKTVPCARLDTRIVVASGVDDAGADYRLRGELGRGGMGIVYRARHLPTGRDVALKVARNPTADNNERLIREARTVARLEHPAIIPVYEIAYMDANSPLNSGGGGGKRPFLAMRRLPKGGAWKPKDEERERNFSILATVADAVAFAHARRVLHLDLKPANVMLGKNGEIFVLDWGLSLSRIESGRGEAAAHGLVYGTPAYVSPEAARGDRAAIGVASDIYLLGAILYEILHGSPPHRAPSVSEEIALARDNIIGKEHVAEALLELYRVAMKAMATDPAERYRSVKQFREDFLRERRSPQFIGMLGEGDRLRNEALANTGADADSRADYEKLDKAALVYAMAGNLLAEPHPLLLSRQAELSFAHADVACRHGDLQLALSQLDAAGKLGHDPAPIAALRKKTEERLVAARQEKRRHGRLRKVAVAAALGLLATLIVFAVMMADYVIISARANTLYHAGSEFLTADIIGKVYPDIQHLTGSFNARKKLAQAMNKTMKTLAANSPSSGSFLAANRQERLQLAKTFRLYGQVLEDVGENRDALDNFRESLARNTVLHGEDPGNPHYRFALSKDYFRIGWVGCLMKEFEPARENIEEALRLLRELHAGADSLEREGIDPEEVLDDLYEAEFIRFVILQDGFHEIETAIAGYAGLAARLEDVLARRSGGGSRRDGDLIVGIRLANIYGRMRRIAFRQGKKEEALRCLQACEKVSLDVVRQAQDLHRLDVVRNQIFAMVASVDLLVDFEKYDELDATLKTIESHLPPLLSLEPRDEWLNHFHGLHLRKRYEQSFARKEFARAGEFLDREIAAREEYARTVAGEYNRCYDLAAAYLLLGILRLNHGVEGDAGQAFARSGVIVEEKLSGNGSVPSPAAALKMQLHVALADLHVRQGPRGMAAARECLDKAFSLRSEIDKDADWQAAADLALLSAHYLHGLHWGDAGDGARGYPALLKVADEYYAGQSNDATRLYRLAAALLPFAKAKEVPDAYRKRILDAATRAVRQALVLETRVRYQELLEECEQMLEGDAGGQG